MLIGVFANASIEPKYSSAHILFLSSYTSPYLIFSTNSTDTTNLKVAKGKFAHVYVEISLKELVVGKVFVEDDYFRFEYEDLHILCSK